MKIKHRPGLLLFQFPGKRVMNCRKMGALCNLTVRHMLLGSERNHTELPSTHAGGGRVCRGGGGGDEK